MNNLLFWGKCDDSKNTHHLLEHHMLDVAAVFEAFADADSVVAQRLERLSGKPLADILPLLLFFAAIHDLGKYGASFQFLQPDLALSLGQPGHAVSDNPPHHTNTGYALYIQVLGEAPDTPLLSYLAQSNPELAPLVGACFGHHGRPVQDCNIKYEFKTSQAHALSFMHKAAALIMPDGPPEPPKDEDAFKPLSWLFAGLLVVADWIGSHQAFFPMVREPMDLEEYWPTARKRATQAVRKCGLLHPRPSRERSFEALVPTLSGRTPRPLQDYALNQAVTGPSPQLHIFEDLTGSGKTEAALLCAHGILSQGGCSGLYAGLPTTATANAMYARLADTYRALFDPGDGVASLMLAHGARMIHDQFLDSIALEKTSRAHEVQDENHARCAAWLADNRKKALLAPCGAGTLDQALLAALPAKHQCLRVLGLCRNVLIADEVHAYDPYTWGLLNSLLTFQAAMGSSAILLTATLPKAKRQELVQAFVCGLGVTGPAHLASDHFPLATRVDHMGRVLETPIQASGSRRVEVALTKNESAMYDELVAAHEAGACACWVRNTVDQALEARRVLVEERGLAAHKIILAHARFALADRLSIEERILARFGKNAGYQDRAGYVVIGTQVLEQSLDLDFDLMLTDLAPMECLIQRAGRCHRHAYDFPRPDEYRSPRMLVLSPEPVPDPSSCWYESVLGKARWVYPFQAELWRTAKILARKKALVTPDDSRELIEGAHGGVSAPEVLTSADQKAKGEAKAQSGMAGINALDPFQGYSKDASFAGWDADTRTPTRLGDQTVRLRLCRVKGDKVELWAGPDLDAKTCARSEVSVSVTRVEDVVVPPRLKGQVIDLSERMPDKARWCLVLPLEQDSTPGVWRGRVVQRGQEVAVEYSSESGLIFAAPGSES